MSGSAIIGSAIGSGDDAAMTGAARAVRTGGPIAASAAPVESPPMTRDQPRRVEVARAGGRRAEHRHEHGHAERGADLAAHREHRRPGGEALGRER